MTRAESVVEGTPSRGMAAGQSYPSLEARLKLEASLKNQLCGHEATPQDGEVLRVCASSPISSTSCLGKGRVRPRTWGLRSRAWYPRLRKLAVVGGTLVGVVLLALFALWWRLSSGPIELDIATPWLTAAIKENRSEEHTSELQSLRHI